MKKLFLILFMVVFGFSFIGVVNAEETDLSKVAIVNSVIGGTEKEINQTDTSNTYKYYYKMVEIDQNDFSTYVNAKYTMENTNDSTDQYATAAAKVSEYETAFYGLIPTVNNASELSSWTQISNNKITLSNLKYEQGKHNGYVFAVVAVKDGDSNIYINRNILESTSATTLGTITLSSNDASVTNTQDTVVSNNEVVENQDTNTASNPETGLSDYAIYLVPIALVVGSTILLRRNYA